MDILKIGILVGIFLSASIVHSNEDSLIGCWDFYKYRYRGEDHFRRDPDLTLRYEFSSPDLSILWWKNTRTGLFCERHGHFNYSSENQILTDLITWTHPENSAECSKDPDMQLGRTSRTQARINSEGEFEFDVQVGNDTVIYVGKPCL